MVTCINKFHISHKKKKEKQPKQKKHLPVSKLIVKTILSFNTLIKNTHGFFSVSYITI